MARTNDPLANRAQILHPTFLPFSPPVAQLPHAVTVRNVAANTRLARACIKDVRVRLCDGQAADGRSAILVENREPGGRAVGGFPDSAASRAKIVRRRIARY